MTSAQAANSFKYTYRIPSCSSGFKALNFLEPFVVPLPRVLGRKDFEGEDRQAESLGRAALVGVAQQRLRSTEITQEQVDDVVAQIMAEFAYRVD